MDVDEPESEATVDNQETADGTIANNVGIGDQGESMEVDNEIFTLSTDDTPSGDSSEADDQDTNASMEEDLHTGLEDSEIPEGVDPEFLAALPEDIRAEVISNHLVQQRAQRINRAATTDAVAAADLQSDAPPEEEVIDQEFLAALAPELQEEILAEREEQLGWRNRRGATMLRLADGIEVHGSATREFHSLFESMFHVLQPDLFPNQLRANMHRQQLFRFEQFSDHEEVNTSSFRRNRSMRDFMARIASVEKKGVHQIFDRESLITLLLLHFMDQEEFHQTRFQNFLKLLCLHVGTCDNVIWSLLSILNVLENGGEDNSCLPYGGMLDSFYAKKALAAVKKSLNIWQCGVKIDEKLRLIVCNRIFDTLLVLARSFPQHFSPDNVRGVSPLLKRFYSEPDLSSLWNVEEESNVTPSAEFKPNVKELVQFREIVPPSLEKSPLAFLLNFTNTGIVRNSNTFMDKMMKILNIIAQYTPNDSKLKMNDVSVKWLSGRLQTLANFIPEVCRTEGLKDSQQFFIEIIRILPSQRSVIINIFYKTVEEQSELIRQDLNTLEAELQAFTGAENVDLEHKNPVDESATTTTLPANTVDDDPLATRKNEQPETEIHINALKAFTERNTRQKKLLKSLEILSSLRTRLKFMDDRRMHTSAYMDYTAKANGIPSTSKVQPSSISASGEGAAGEEDEKKFTDLLEHLEPLWPLLSTCMEKMSQVLGSSSVFALQHVAETFFLAHSFNTNFKKSNTAPVALPTIQTEVNSNGASQTQLPFSASSFLPTAAIHTSQLFTEVSQTATLRSGICENLRVVELNKQTRNMFRFAEKHRMVLNQILRSNNKKLLENVAYAILACFPKLLDFDVKRKYFYKEIRKMRERVWYEDVFLRIRRNHLFGDSFRELIRLKPAEWRAHFHVIFEGEEGEDGGGLLREWFTKITREIFNPNYGLFITAPGDRVTYMINKSSYVNPEHLNYFRFVGRVIAKAIYENRQLNCYFTRAFYKHILNVPVRYQDIESEDPSFFKSLEFLLNNPVEECAVDLTFSVEVEEFGERSVRKLKEDGDRITVTDANKDEYVQQVCQMKMTGSIRQQLDAFLEGFYQVISKKLISVFNEQELELLISGLPDINIDDLYNNTVYKNYTRESPQIEWFWIALRSFEQEDLAKFLQFVTGTSKVPLQGFSHLEGMNGVQKLSIHADPHSHDRLPSAHTCFNQLDLPKYESYEELRKMLLLAVRECSEGFAFL